MNPTPPRAHSNTMPHPRSRLALFVLPALILAGCLVQETTLLFRYDPTTDAFHLFAVYEHFRSGDARPAAPDLPFPPANDVETLRRFYLARDHTMPMPQLLEFDGPSRFLLTDDHTRLRDSTELATVAWRDIQIRPGRLFRDPKGYLGYSHDITIPGRVIDQLLAELRAHAVRTPELRERIDRELDRRRTGGRPSDWPTLARRITQLVRRSKQPAADAESFDDSVASLLTCMEPRSLDALRRTFAPSSPGPDLTRVGPTFRLRLPLTPGDTQGLASAARAIAAAIAEAAHPPPGNPPPDSNLQLAAQIATCLKKSGKIEVTPDGDCLLSIDPVPVLNDFADLSRRQADFDTNPQAQFAARAMTQSVRSWPDAPELPTIDPARLKRP